MLFAVGFGVLAAFLFAGSAALQQHAAQRDRYRQAATTTEASTNAAAGAAAVVALVGLVRRLLRTPRPGGQC